MACVAIVCTWKDEIRWKIHPESKSKLTPKEARRKIREVPLNVLKTVAWDPALCQARGNSRGLQG